MKIIPGVFQEICCLPGVSRSSDHPMVSSSYVKKQEEMMKQKYKVEII